MIHKCNDNDTVIYFNIVDGEIKELLVKSIGDKSWIVMTSFKNTLPSFAGFSRGMN